MFKIGFIYIEDCMLQIEHFLFYWFKLVIFHGLSKKKWCQKTGFWSSDLDHCNTLYAKLRCMHSADSCECLFSNLSFLFLSTLRSRKLLNRWQCVWLQMSCFITEIRLLQSRVSWRIVISTNTSMYNTCRNMSVSKRCTCNLFYCLI